MKNLLTLALAVILAPVFAFAEEAKKEEVAPAATEATEEAATDAK